MTLENTIELLERVRNYKLDVDSLKDELTKSSGEMSDTIKGEIEEQTELIMQVRAKINLIRNSGVRNVLRMRYLNDKSFADISKKLGITYQWVNKLHNRGIEELSKLL